YPVDLSARGGAGGVIRRGRPERFAEISEAQLRAYARDGDHLALLRRLGYRSYMCVPLRARERTLGALTFVSTRADRHYDEADLALAEEVGRRAALAVDNARLYGRARESEASLRLLAETIPQLVWTATPDGAIDYLNDRWFDYTGTRPEAILGHS